MNSKQQFEEWLCSFPVKPDLTMIGNMYKNKYVESRWIGWQAGRESMRDEAADKLSKDDSIRWSGAVDELLQIKP